MQDATSGSKFRVVGKKILTGEIVPQGNKNEALPLLAACCLTDEPVTLENVPAIEDVLIMRQIIEALGMQVTPGATPASVTVRAAKAARLSLPEDLCARMRGAVALAGPLLARFGKVFLPKPGGDRIGRRRLDTHILALQALGAKVTVKPNGFLLRAPQLVGADLLLDETSVTGTENAICAAVLAKGETTIRNAASEPHVQGLCRLLVKMGAKIDGIGSNILHLTGVNHLHGATHRIGPDYLEVGSFITLAAVTGGELLIKDVNLADLRMIRAVFARLGITTIAQGTDLLVPPKQKLIIKNDMGGAVPKIDDAPWPGFPADLTSVALVTATQCRGTILIHEKMFESRLFFTDSLISMGARIILCDPHRALVMGRDRLRGARLSSPDIRAGMAMLIAALCAEGESVIHNIIQIDRGFTNIDERLCRLGAHIERLP